MDDATRSHLRTRADELEHEIQPMRQQVRTGAHNLAQAMASGFPATTELIDMVNALAGGLHIVRHYERQIHHLRQTADASEV